MNGDALVIRALKASARLRLQEPVARLLSRRIKVERETAEASYRVLYLDKLGLAEDVHSSLGCDPRFTLLSLDRAALKAVARAFLPEDLTDNSYSLDRPGFAEAKAGYRSFLRGVFWRLASWHRIDAVMSANFAYVAERELHAAADECGVPFLVLQKENLKTPGNFPFFASVYRDLRGPILARRQIVYNEIERALEIESGVARPEQVVVTGMPRLDRLHEWRRMHNGAVPQGRPNVLCFYFSDRTGLGFDTLIGPSIYSDEGGPIDPAYRDRRWTELRRLTVRSMVDLARTNPEIDVVVKGKFDHAKGNEMAAAVREHGKPDNLTLISGGDPVALIQHADVVCGFISTALLEALAAGKPVVQPQFAEAADSEFKGFLIDLMGAGEVAASPKELVDRLAELAKQRTPVHAELAPAAAAALDHWTGNSDGRAGERVAAAVAAEIDASRAPDAVVQGAR